MPRTPFRIEHPEDVEPAVRVGFDLICAANPEIPVEQVRTMLLGQHPGTTAWAMELRHPDLQEFRIALKNAGLAVSPGVETWWNGLDPKNK